MCIFLTVCHEGGGGEQNVAHWPENSNIPLQSNLLNQEETEHNNYTENEKKKAEETV